MSETPDDDATPCAVLNYDQDQSRQAPLEGFSNLDCIDDSVRNESHGSNPCVSQLDQNSWLEELPVFQIQRDSRDENEGSPVHQSNGSEHQALSTTQYPQEAKDIIRRLLLRRMPEQRATDPVGVSNAGLEFLASLPERQGQPSRQRRRSAFSQMQPAVGESDVPQPIPESDTLLQLHQETDEALRNFGLFPNGERFSWDADFVFPDPITMNQPGDNLHETFAVDLIIH